MRPRALNNQETMDKVGPVNYLIACHIKNVFPHLCLIIIAGFGNLTANISQINLKKLLNLPEIVFLFPPILFQIILFQTLMNSQNKKLIARPLKSS